MEYRKPVRGTRSLTSLLALMLVLGTCSLNAAEATRIYRYYDNDGKLVYNSFIPAEFVRNGYTILNQKGSVLDEIPRTLTPEEMAEQIAERAKTRQQEEARIARQEADLVLLRVYRTPEDIQRKRDLSLADFDAQISATTAELERLDVAIAQFGQDTDSTELAELQTQRE